MGGALILVATVIATLLWSDLGNRFIWITLFTCVGFGLIGWIDDRGKLRGDEGRGLSKRQKFFWQSIVAAGAASMLFAMAQSPVETQLIVPLFKSVAVNLGLGYVLLAWFVIVGSSNAVNLTDGLDGLAILPSVLVAGGMGIFAYLTGHAIFSGYLGIPHISGAGEVLVFCSALMGAGLGFLWFNTYPAQVFMGDVGSLSTGAALGTLAVLLKKELLLFIIGGVFVWEAVSVMLQVSYYRWTKIRTGTGQRIFKMAPIHHHYELKGWPESRIVIRFWIIGILLALFSLTTFKIR